jgi:methyl-accepting chemotaxis protein
MNPTDTMPSKRTSRIFGQYIIKSRFQFKFSLVVFFFMSAVAFFVWMEGNFAVTQMIQTGAVTGEEAIAQLHLLSGMIARTFVLGLALTFGMSLFFSHFVAGPIYRFQRVLDDMKTGKLNMHVQLRKRDEFKEVADSFNQALSSLRVKLREERAAVAAQADKIAELAATLKQQGASAEAQQLENLLADLKQLPPRIQI